MLYFVFKGVKYDIPMCQSHSTYPHNAKKELTSTFQAKFQKIRHKNLYGIKRHLTASAQFFFSQCQQVPGAYLGQILTQTDTSKSSTPKMGRGREIELRRIKNGRLGLDSIVQISDISPVVTDNVWIKLNSFLLFSSFSCRWIKRVRRE